MSTVPDGRISTDIGPFAMVPEWLARSGLSAGAIQTWVMLAVRADRASYSCWPSRKTLGEEMDCSERTVDARIKELVDLGALTKEPVFVDGHQKSNLYHLRMLQSVAGGGAADCDPSLAGGYNPRGASDFARTRTNEPESKNQKLQAAKKNAKRENCGSCEDGWVIDLDTGPGSVRRCPNGCSQRPMESLS